MKITEKLNECVSQALKDEKVASEISKRENKKIPIKTIDASIVRKKDERDFFAMIVRVGFDFFVKDYTLKYREDIIVDVIYKKHKRTNEESFKINTPYSVPEILDLSS